MTYQFLRIERQSSVTVVTIQRPNKLNALSLEVFCELKEYLLRFAGELNGCRVLVLRGAGEKAFSAGADLQQMSLMTSQEAEEISFLAQEVTFLLEELPVPVIAAVHGVALGGGCELALACDFIFATEHSVFGQPEVKLGLIPGFGGCVRLARRVGITKARELIFWGQSLSATEAQTVGLVSRIFKDESELMEAIFEGARQLQDNSQEAISIGKRVLNEQARRSIEEGLRIERAGYREVFDHHDRKERIEKFLHKRRS